jgi:hypothetical protein
MSFPGCPYQPYCSCPDGLVDINCPALDPRVPLDHEPIHIEEPPLFKWSEVAGLFAFAIVGLAALWFGAR